jgi:ribonuclease HIII
MGSLAISNDELENLKGIIREEKLNCESVKNSYELLRIKENDIVIIVYRSGKLVYNDSDASKQIVNSILIKDFEYDFILGSDETGKGEWFGPLVVVATALTPDEIVDLRMLSVQDSKKIKKSQLLKLGKKLKNMDFQRYSVILNPRSYNKLYSKLQREGKSLNDMMAWAHSVVIKELIEKIEFKKVKVVIDKFDFEKTEYRLENVDKRNLEIIQKSGGESEIPVAAASIIAKYLFELEVDKLNKKYQIDLRKVKPKDVSLDVLPTVAKVHFKNIKNIL